MWKLFPLLKEHSIYPQITENMAQIKEHAIETEGQAELSKELHGDIETLFLGKQSRRLALCRDYWAKQSSQ